MNILAIDQSITCTAYCYFESGKLLSFGCIKTKITDGSLHDRCYKISKKLKRLKKDKELDNKVIVCVREGLAFGNTPGNATRDLATLVGYIQSDLGEMLEVAPTSVKKFATGKGRWAGDNKQPMIDALPAQIREDFTSAGYKKTTGLSDLADAYFIGKYFVENNKGEDF